MTFLLVFIYGTYNFYCAVTYGGYESFFMGKADEKRPMRKLRRIWECNIKIDLQEVGWEHRLD